jgi:hypothetical protein
VHHSEKTDIPETLQKGVLHLRPVPAQYGYLVAGLLLVTTVGLVTDKRRVHAALCIAWLLISLGWGQSLPHTTRFGAALT